MKTTVVLREVLLVALALSWMGCKPTGKPEQPAPAGRLVVTTGDGQRLSGVPARVDIRFPGPGAGADVEVFFTAGDASGDTWAAHAKLSNDFLQRRPLVAAVTTGAMGTGQASVEISSPAAGSRRAGSGELRLHLDGRRLAGELTGAPARFAARFEGPFEVTCSVSSKDLPSNAPAPVGSGAGVLVVDTGFETALCRPFAALASP